MSGNDRGSNGKLVMNSVQIRDYMEHFAIPVATELISCRKLGMTGSKMTNHIDNFVADLLGEQ